MISRKYECIIKILETDGIMYRYTSIIDFRKQLVHTDTHPKMDTVRHEVTVTPAKIS